MVSQTVEDLRAHLFATIEALRDDKQPMEVGRARAIAAVAGQIIQSARVEVEHLKITGGGGSAFLGHSGGDVRRLTSGTETATHLNGMTVRRHIAQS